MDVLEKLYASCVENIEVVEASEVSVEEFRERFDKANKPCIIRGCVDEHWNFEKNWTWRVRDHSQSGYLRQVQEHRHEDR